MSVDETMAGLREKYGVDRSPTTGDVVMVKASTVRPRPIEWIEEHRIPNGALTLLAGNGGMGKSTIAVDRASRASRGQLPGCYHGQPVDVVWAGNEDGRDDVLVPRLIAAGADLDRIHFAEWSAGGLGEDLDLVVHIDRLRARCGDADARLLVVDPVVEFLPGDTDSHKDMSVRQALRPLRALAQRSRIGALGLIHFNKAATLDVATKLAGSAAFRNAARSVLVVGPHPDEPETLRVLFQNKTNLGPEERTGRSYRIEEHRFANDTGELIRTGRVVWGAEVDLDPSTFSVPERERPTPKADAADELLDELLGGGDLVPVARFEAEALTRKIGWRTLKERKAAGGVETIQEKDPETGQMQPAQWRLPGVQPTGVQSPRLSEDCIPGGGPQSLTEHRVSDAAPVRCAIGNDAGEETAHRGPSGLDDDLDAQLAALDPNDPDHGLRVAQLRAEAVRRRRAGGNPALAEEDARVFDRDTRNLNEFDDVERSTPP